MTTTRRGRRTFVLGGLAVLAIAALVVAAIVLTGSSPDNDERGQSASAADTGPTAPAIAFQRFDGTTASLADYRGEPLVVNFWASWCPSCVAEMSAAFRPAQQQLDDEVAFLGLNLQDERSRAEDLVEQTGVLFDLAEDRNGDIYVALGGLAMPFTVFIDEAGSVVHKHNGTVTEAQLIDLIEQHLLG